MNAIKRFFINFRKHGSISRVSDERARVSNIENCSTEGVKTTLIQDDKHVENKEETRKVLGQENRDSIENSEGIEENLNNPRSQYLSENVAENPAADRTTECLKEFDDILKDVSRDITDACDSLDDIEDVLNIIEEEDSKASLFETPRFDLQDLIQNVGSIDGKLLDNIIDNGPNDITLTEVIDVDEIDEPNELVIDDTIHLNTMEYHIETGKDVDVAEVISISSEDSQPPNSFKLDGKLYEQNVRLIHEPKDAKDEKDEQKKVVDKKEGAKDKPKNVNLVTDEPVFVDDDEVLSFIVKPQSKNVELKGMKMKNKEFNDEPTTKAKANVTNENDESNLKSKDSSSVDSDDCGYHSSDFEFITEEEAKMDGLIINVNPSLLKPKVNKTKRVKTIEIGIDKSSRRRNPKRTSSTQNTPNECNSFHSKLSLRNNIAIRQGENNEFLKADSNLQAGSSVQNNTRRQGENNEFLKANSNLQADISVKNNTRSALRNVRRIRHQDLHHLCMEPDVTTEENNQKNSGDTITNCTQSNDVLEITYTRPNMSEISNLENMQVDCPGIITDSSTKLSSINCSGSNGFGHTNSLESRPTILGPGPSFQENNIGYGPSNSQRNHPDNTSHGPTNSLENMPTNLGPSQSSQENGFGFRPSNLGNSSGFNNLQESNLLRNCPKTPDLSYERWRALRNRNQNQFVLDQSYRDNHRMLENEEYYRLFDPNFGPLPNQGMRQMENKSFRSRNMMLVEYEGVGFDMQMMREWSETEDEVKEQAGASARKILDMYPGENRKRRRRF